MIQAVRIAFASLLVVALLALGGLSIAASGADSALRSVVTGADLPGTGVEATEAVQLNNGSTSQPASPLNAPAGQTAGVPDARAAYKSVDPAVVTVVNKLQAPITGSGGQGFGSLPSPQALGSGVIIDSQGHIVTNNHVVENQASLEVIFSDGKRVPATIVGTDSFSDLAVIKVSVAVPAVAQFGDSSKLEPGQPVAAIGSSLGNYTNTITEGIISGLHRQIDGGGTSLRDLLQTDAAINHGNSGGPLIDIATAQVIGINTAVVRSDGSAGADTAEGLGFAIPSNTVRTVVDSLIKDGTIQRPYLGIEYLPVTPQVAAYYGLSRQSGVYVDSVAQGSPAAKAGIQAKSIITKFDGTTLDDNTNTLVDLLLKHKVGDSVRLTVVAPGSNNETDVSVVLGSRPGNP